MANTLRGQDLLGMGLDRSAGRDESDMAGQNYPVPDFELVHKDFDAPSYRKAEDERKKTFAENWLYYDGKHRRFLKVPDKVGAVDDNVIVNFCAVLIDRTVARLFGDPTRNEMFGFDIEHKAEVEEAAVEKAETYGEERLRVTDPQEREAQFKLNEIWRRSGGLHKVVNRFGMFGAITGEAVFKIVLEDEGPRVIVMDSSLLGMLTREDDKDQVKAYKIEYQVYRRDPEDVNQRIKQVTFRQLVVDGPAYGGPRGWWIQDFIDWGKKAVGDPQWTPASDIEAWEFCPLIATQNLPHARSSWGQSDMTNVRELNDEMNFLLSNVNKIVRHHAHPRTIAIGVDPDGIVETSIDQFWAIAATPDEVEIKNLEMESDLNAAYAFFHTIKEAFWTIGREADPATFKEKIGNVTNFGLRVLFLDALNKLGQKRETYGKAIIALIERLFELEDMGDLTVVIKWPDPLPSDPREAVETAMMEIDAGILSRETAARERGRNWKLELKRIKDYAQQESELLGQKFLRAMRGDGQGETITPRTDRRNLDGPTK